MSRTTTTLIATLVALAALVPHAGAQQARAPSRWEPATETSWPVSPGGDSFLSGYNPTEKAPRFIECRDASCRKTGDADGPWLAWSTKLSDLPSGTFPQSGVLVHDGIVYVSGGGTNSFLALDQTTGLPVWRFAPDPRADGVTSQYPGSNAPTIRNGIVYVTFGNGFMYALNAKTGRKIWSYRALEGYRDTTPSRPGDADHPPRAALDSYTDSSQLDKRGQFLSVHPGVTYPKIHGRTAYCTEHEVVAFMTLSGWVYGLDGRSGKLLWKRYADAPEFPGEMVWPEYKEGGALNPKNSSLGSSTRRFEAVPGIGCANRELQISGSDGHMRFLDPRTGKQGRYRCGYSRSSCSDEGGNVGMEYERLDVDANGGGVDMCAASGFNCDIAIGLGLPPVPGAPAGAPGGPSAGDYIFTTLDSRIIRINWQDHRPLWNRRYAGVLPFQTAGSMPLSLEHVEHGFITQALVASPMAIDPDIAGTGARPILYAAAQDGRLYVLSVNERGGGLRPADPLGPRLLARVDVQPNAEVETPYTRRGLGGPWDNDEAALSSLTLGGGVLYVPTWDNKITGFDVRDPENPRRVWEHEITWDRTFRYPPFGRTYDGPLVDVDMKIWSAPALVGGHLYFTANDGTVYAFSLTRKPARTRRNLVVLGSGLVPFLPEYEEALGTFDTVWTPEDFYKNQTPPPGFELPASVAGAGALLLGNLVLFWWFRRRGDIVVEVRR